LNIEFLERIDDGVKAHAERAPSRFNKCSVFFS